MLDDPGSRRILAYLGGIALIAFITFVYKCISLSKLEIHFYFWDEIDTPVFPSLVCLAGFFGGWQAAGLPLCLHICSTTGQKNSVHRDTSCNSLYISATECACKQEIHFWLFTKDIFAVNKNWCGKFHYWNSKVLLLKEEKGKSKANWEQPIHSGLTGQMRLQFAKV